MALVKPILNEIVAFDANIGTTITFTASGGDQVTKNGIKVILNNDDPTETVVYTNVVTSYNLSHNIPSGVLTNGTYYKVAVQTYDAIGNTSEWSKYQPFYCYATPNLVFNITNGQTLNKANYNVVLTYRQTEGEKVDYAIIQLYNGNNMLISSSGNLYNSTTPPLNFAYAISGLENHSQYKLVGTVVTVNGTIVKQEVLFYTNYGTIVTDVDLTATLDSCNGYVNLHSTAVTNLVGISNPSPADYIDNKMVDLLCPPDIDQEEYSKWVKWTNALIVPTNFLLRLWFYPAKQPYHILTLVNNLGTDYLNITMNRGTTEDYLSIRASNGTAIDKGLGQHCNGNTKVFLWLCIDGSTWTVQTSILSTEATVINWEDTDNCNIHYNVDTDIVYGGESFESFTPVTPTYAELPSEMHTLKIGNGIFDALNLTTDTSLPYSTTIPSWDNKTILSVGFNGNLKNDAPYYTKLVLKRKDDTLLTWIALSEIEVQENVLSFINFNDSFIPTGIQQTYSLTTYIDGVPSDPYVVDITPQWGKYFLSDKNNRFVLNYAVIYSNNNQNIQNGVFMPIGAKYPIVVQNGEGNYRSGSIQFKVLGYQYEINQRLDRISIKNQLDDILAFLTNGTAKCITDFNGNIFIFKVINSPQISYDGNWGNGIATVSFDWVEQTKYNDYQGMLELGLFDYIAGD